MGELELQIVVAEGIVSADEADALARAARSEGQDLLARLRADGRISEATLATLRARVNAGSAGAATLDAAPAGPDDAAFPVPGWDRYEPIRLLGQGGMGRVFLARDLRLGRDVAIKFVRGDDPELARRILGEARAQARVEDDRVCKVFEVGEVRGRVYIAMQAIDGQPLSELTAALTFEQKAMVVRGAALGVHEAHRVGLIHRDLKPSNILVERTAAGELRPFVMDFGIARDWADGATATGTVLGTPQFMAPEQARGEVRQLDRRTDVYSLGATLYAALTGRAPITGDNPLIVLNRVALDEPPRPRAIDPAVPADLEAIAMKCLEKEPAARYDSARALADDLGRFLDGAPVAARASAGLGYRLRRQLRRRWRLVALAAALALVIAIALGYGVRERRAADRREALARRFTERVERIEALARASALAPAHDLRADRALIQAEMDAIAATLRDGDVAAGHYALGRGHLALADAERAEAELTRAWQGGFRDPRAAYALALALGQLYERGLREAQLEGGAAGQALRRTLEERYRAPALALLRQSAGPGVSPPGYVAALIAFREDRAAEALAHLDAIDLRAGGMASFYEAPLLRGQILVARAVAATGADTGARATADLEAARAALATAAAIAESDPAVQVAIAELEYTAFASGFYSGGELDGPFRRGVEAAGRALAMLPDHADALAVRARLQRSYADHRARLGEDVTALLAGALADAERATALAPDRGRRVLVSVLRQQGELALGLGHDPAAPLGRALAVIDGIPERDRGAAMEVERGLIHTVWADHQDEAGADSTAHRGAAIAAYRAALALDPAMREAWLNLGSNYLRRASVPDAPTADADLVEARAALARGQTLDPDNFAGYLYDAQVHALVAQREEARGGDPGPARTRAIALYRTAIGKHPGEPQLHSELSAVYVEEAAAAIRAGRDPTPHFDLAEAAAREAIAVAPDAVYGHNNLGDAQLQRATWLLAQGRDPRPVAAAAIAAFTDALARLPGHPTIVANLAEARAVAARWRGR